MDIVITHEGTDFDGLAAMIAVTKIYPGTLAVFPGYLSNQVKDFMALFKDEFQVLRPRDLDLEAVQRVIMVDTKDPSRVGPFRDLLYRDDLEKIVYDHHILDEQSFDFDFKDFTSPVGSTTTLLVQRIKMEEIPITPMEATLFALGIYHDTGCLTYSTTTPLDAEMVAFLLRNGAGLNVVEEFVEFALNEAQQEVLNVLLDQVENLSIHGLRVDVYSAKLSEYLLGVNNVIHKLREIREADLYFVIVEMNHRVLVVGRADVESVHLGEFMEKLGGGGHSGAASAVVKKAELEEVKPRIIQMLKDYIQRPHLTRDIMTTPVKTITPDAPIRQAEEIMLRYGHSGLVVMDDQGVIRGVFSRRDLDKVKKHDLYDAPTKGYMSRKVVTISPDVPVSQAQRLMVSHDIGRLPVVNDAGKLVGIITRTDLLKDLYGDNMTTSKNYYGSSLVELNPQSYNIQPTLAQSPPELYELFCQIRDLSDRMQMKPYLVGGFARDLLLNRPSQDLDIVVEGDGIEFSKQLHEMIGGRLLTHPEFKTASIEINSFHLDVATARVEYYEYPAALPQVEPGLLKQDLYRRDFTINTMAISLSKEKFGWLLDFFGGKKDLEMGILRGLHSFTFIDDPTRILRGIRFAVRFGFKIEEETSLLIRQAMRRSIFQELKGPRLWEELKSILMEKNAEKALRYIENYGILQDIYPELKLTDRQWSQLRRVSWAMELFKAHCTDEVRRWLVVLMIIFRHLSTSEINRLAKEWNLSLENLNQLRFALKGIDPLKEKLEVPELKSSTIYDLLSPLGCEELVFLLLLSDSGLVVDRVIYYIQHLRGIEVEISGKDILDLGFQPGPLFKRAMDAVKRARLNGDVTNYQEELDFIKEYFFVKEGEESGSNNL